MKILALDTSTAACSVALWDGDEGREVFEVAGNRHSSLILQMVECILSEAGIALGQCDAIAFGEGPGSFTGLRIGVGVVQGLAFGADIPVLPVSSLQAQANRRPAARVLCAFDARMQQVYWCSYELGPTGIMVPLADVALSAPQHITLDSDQSCCAIGSGCDQYRGVIEAGHPDVKIDFIARSFPHALDVARLAAEDKTLANARSAEHAVPRYIRNKVTD